jgi:hypothetical protein
VDLARNVLVRILEIALAQLTLVPMFEEVKKITAQKSRENLLSFDI